MTPSEEIWDKIAIQKAGYKELEKFVPGEAGFQYFPVPEEEHKAWEKEQERKNMEAYELKEATKRKALLDLREDTGERGNGHNKPQVTLYEGHPSLTTCKYCNNTVGKCNCKDNPKFDKINPNPDHCDLKKKSIKKRSSSSKKK